MVWYAHLFQNFPQFLVIHTVEGFGTVNKAEIDVFLELSWFFDDPEDVGNLISGCSAFSKASLNIWKVTVHILLKPGLEKAEWRINKPAAQSPKLLALSLSYNLVAPAYLFSEFRLFGRIGTEPLSFPPLSYPHRD